MAILLLIRHGENDMVGTKLAGRLAGVHLNEKGHAQAQRLAAELAALPLKAVIASPLERAQETAFPIAHMHNLPVETEPALLEIDFGTWQGKHLKLLKRRRLWKDIQNQPSSVRFPDGESFTEAQQRICDALKALSERFDEKETVVCVAHSDVIRLALAFYLGMPLDHFQRIRIAPASVSVLFLQGEQSICAAINHTLDFPAFPE